MSSQVDCSIYFDRVEHPVAIIDDGTILRYANPQFLTLCDLDVLEEIPLISAVERTCNNKVNLHLLSQFIASSLREPPKADRFVTRCLDDRRIRIMRLVTGPQPLFLLEFDLLGVEDGELPLEQLEDLKRLVQDQRLEIYNQAHRYAEIFDHAGEAILLFLRDGSDWILNDTNQAARDMLGRDHASLLNRHLQEFLPGELLHQLEESFELGLLLEEGLQTESILRVTPEQELPVKVQARLLELREGSVLQLYLQGVAERRLMEDKLRRRVRELSILHEISSVLLESRDLNHVYHIILTGVTFGQGLGFNRAFLLFYDEDSRRLTGETAVGPANREEADHIWDDLNRQDMNLQSILHSYQEISSRRDVTINNLVRQISIQLEEGSSRIQNAFNHNQHRALEREEVESPEDHQLLDYLGADTCWIAPIISFAGEQPQWRGALVVDNIITGRVPSLEDIEALGICAHNLALTMERFDLINELKIKIQHLEELYQKYRESSQKLLFAEKLAAMGKVATRIAHEIKNPLVSIGGFAQKLKKAMAPDDRLNRYATIITDEVRRLENTLYSVLYFSNLRQTEKQPFAIADLLNHCAELFADELERAGIELEIKLAPEVGEIVADYSQLEQVFINLLRNAIEAIGEGGRIGLSVEADQDNYYFKMEDNGSGLSMDDFDMPFESFFSTKATGTGLGLTITREIVDNHGGKIQLVNRDQGGTCVSMHLPQRSGGAE